MQIASSKTAPLFFFSYARADYSEHLLAFFRDLESCIERRGGRNSSGFMDVSGIERGEVWEEALVAALASARVFVAATSPTYWSRPYCGKEWAAFDSRVQSLRASAELGAKRPPPLILPLLWFQPFRVDMVPFEVARRQFRVGHPTSLANEKDVETLARRRALHPEEYDDFVQSLARRIFMLASDNPAIDQHASVPALNDLRSAFEVLEFASRPLSPDDGSLTSAAPAASDIGPVLEARPEDTAEGERASNATMEVAAIDTHPRPTKEPLSVLISLDVATPAAAIEWLTRAMSQIPGQVRMVRISTVED